jgi:muramoyltetrapeptide carboxypeptidase
VIKPKRLQKGDTIGIISPSYPSAGQIPSRLERGIRAIQRLGYSVKIGKHVWIIYGHKAGTASERVEDIHEMFEDTNVKAIIASIGGYNSNELLDLIDYNLIKRNPKIFCGYSDITALHCGIHTLSGLVTFYGPNVMSQFAEFGGPLRYTIDSFQKAVSSKTAAVRRIIPSREYTYEWLEWGKHDKRRPRKLIRSPQWNVLKSGYAEGELIGGHLRTVADLAGTRYFPDFTKKIFFWEETESNTALTDSILMYLKMLGVFDRIRGMIIGRINPNEYQ